MVTRTIAVAVVGAALSGAPTPLVQCRDIVLVSGMQSSRDSEHGSHPGHPVHVPGTRLIATTSTTTLISYIAVPDFDHVVDAASDRAAEDLRPVPQVIRIDQWARPFRSV